MTAPRHGWELPTLRYPVLTFADRELDLGHKIAVVAIVNRTPDSFYDKGATFALESAIQAARNAVKAGADWIDIGGVPFGPGPEVTPDEEIRRVIPVVEALQDLPGTIISVETTNSTVADAAYSAGAHVINDTSGLYDPQMAATAARHNGGLLIVHSSSPPRVKVHRPVYDDVVSQVRDFLLDRVRIALEAGVAPERIVIDPGHDLNKNTFHSLELTRRLDEITSLGQPVLVAVSNKDFIGESLDASIDQRVSGSVAMATVCVMQGARLIRVHNVAESVSAVRTAAAVFGWIEPPNPVHNMG